MLRGLKDLHGLSIKAQDGEIGQVEGFYFDDRWWLVRYFVVETGNWLAGDKILLSTTALSHPSKMAGQLAVSLTIAEVTQHLKLKPNRNVVMQQENALLSYEDGPPLDEMGGGLFEEQIVGLHPDAIFETIKAKENEEPKIFFKTAEAELQLRPSKEVIGSYIEARDGDIGHVEDFIVDDETWTIQYMVVDTRNWLPGKKVLVAPTWIEQINWPDGKVHIDLSQETIQNSPEYNPAHPIERTYEENLYDYYDRQKYWL
jgi:hypothetical protein